MDLCKAEGNDHNRKLVENHIELLTAEIKSRDGDKEILQDGDISSKTAE